MKKKNRLYMMAGLLCLASLTGCEDRLNIGKHGDVGSQETYYQTDDQVESAASALSFPALQLVFCQEPFVRRYVYRRWFTR